MSLPWVLWVVGGSIVALALAWREATLAGPGARRGLRVLAVLAASLGLIGLPLSLRHVSPSGETSIRLVTGPTTSRDPASTDYVLPRAAAAGRTAGVFAPDAAYAIRANPTVARVEVAGSGLTRADAAALAGYSVIRIDEPDQPPIPVGPQLTVLTVPERIALGEKLQVAGQARGFAPGQSASLALEQPDGTVQTTTAVAGADGEMSFELDGGIPVAAGRYRWRLREGQLGPAIPIGVDVVPSPPLRVLLWASAPSAELARLQRWLSDEGHRVESRFQVSRDRIRQRGVDETAIAGWDRERLRGFDVLVIDGPSVADLGAAADADLGTAVEQDGLGVVVLTESTLARDWLGWSTASIEVESDTDATASDAAARRLILVGKGPIDEPVSVAAATVRANPALRRLAVDPFDRILVADHAWGEGRVAVSLVQASWRWPLQGHPEIYARYWSHLLGAVAKPTDSAPTWVRVESGRLPQVDEVVKWRRLRDLNQPSRVEIVAPSGHRSRIDVIAQDRIQFWPVEPGWHRLESPGQPDQAFDVLPAGSLPTVIAREAEDRLARVAVERAGGESVPTERALEGTKRGGATIAFLLMLAGLTVLWTAERNSRS